MPASILIALSSVDLNNGLECIEATSNVLHAKNGPTGQKLVSILFGSLSGKLQGNTKFLLIGLVLEKVRVRV